jgi:hypothetical protein
MKQIYVTAVVTLILTLDDDEPPARAETILRTVIAAGLEDSAEDFTALTVTATTLKELSGEAP